MTSPGVSRDAGERVPTGVRVREQEDLVSVRKPGASDAAAVDKGSVPAADAGDLPAGRVQLHDAGLLASDHGGGDTHIAPLRIRPVAPRKGVRTSGYGVSDAGLRAWGSFKACIVCLLTQ